MTKVPEYPQYETKPKPTMIACFQPGTSDADKQIAMKEIEEYMAFRRARYLKSKKEPVNE